MVLPGRYVPALISVGSISLGLLDDLRHIDLREVHELVDDVPLVVVDALHLQELLDELYLLRLPIAALHIWFYSNMVPRTLR